MMVGGVSAPASSESPASWLRRWVTGIATRRLGPRGSYHPVRRSPMPNRWHDPETGSQYVYFDRMCGPFRPSLWLGRLRRQTGPIAAVAFSSPNMPTNIFKPATVVQCRRRLVSPCGHVTSRPLRTSAPKARGGSRHSAHVGQLPG
jgi:hypothetical protein